MLTLIMPDPEYYFGGPRKELYGDTVSELRLQAREYLTDLNYGASDVGSMFFVYRDGARMGTMMYNGVFHKEDPLLDVPL